MQDKTKTLCYWASQLYQSDILSSNEIYDRLLNSKSRKREVSKAKQLVGYLLYNHYNFTQQMIASEFNLLNHSTVIHWLDQVQSELKTNKRMQYRYSFMKDIINGKQVKLIKQKHTYFSKHDLSEADKQFIKDNFNNGFCISYFADVLNKTRKCVKSYFDYLSNEKNIFNAPKANKYRVHSFNKRQTIDY